MSNKIPSKIADTGTNEIHELLIHCKNDDKTFELFNLLKDNICDGHKIPTKDENKDMPIHLAFKYGHTRIAESLI
jgi:hypothetical protein